MEDKLKITGDLACVFIGCGVRGLRSQIQFFCISISSHKALKLLLIEKSTFHSNLRKLSPTPLFKIRCLDTQ